jgi:predicted nucleic acid-binding protein
LLLRAKEKWLITAIKPYAMVIQQANLYLSDVVVNEALRLVGE